MPLLLPVTYEKTGGENGQVREFHVLGIVSHSYCKWENKMESAHARMMFTRRCLNGDRTGQGRDRSGVRMLVGNALVGSKRPAGGRLTFHHRHPPCLARFAPTVFSRGHVWVRANEATMG